MVAKFYHNQLCRFAGQCEEKCKNNKKIHDFEYLMHLMQGLVKSPQLTKIGIPPSSYVQDIVYPEILIIKCDFENSFCCCFVLLLLFFLGGGVVS